MTEPQSTPDTSNRVVRPDEVVLETAKPAEYPKSWPGYLVQAHDQYGRALWDDAGRPVLVPQDSTPASHPLDRQVSLVLLVVVLLLTAVCIIGGIGLHYLDQIRLLGGFIPN